jgi:predicted lipoprotein
MRRLLVVLLLLLPAGAYARTDAEWTSFNLEMARQYIAPRFAALAEAADGLDESASAFCQGPTPEALANLRAAFLATVEAWAEAEHLRTGPASIHNRAERIYFWPERKNVTQRQLSALLRQSDVTSLTAEALAGASVAVQGLPALEMLLYDEDDAAALQAGDAPHCAAVRAIAANVATIAAELAHEWSAEGSFLATLAHPETPNPFFATGAEATKRFFNDLLTQYQLMSSVKLLAPLGTTPDRARPRLVEGWRSGRSLAMIAANLRSAHAMYGPEDGFGLHRLLPDGIDSHEIDREIRNALEATELALAEVPEPLDEAVVTAEGRQAIMMVIHHLHRVYEQTAGRFGPAADMSVGFNGLDGD